MFGCISPRVRAVNDEDFSVLDQNSTRADALAQLNANLSWEGSPSKAGLVLEALRWLCFNEDEEISDESSRIRRRNWEKQLDRVQEYVDSVGAASMARQAAFVRARPI